MGRERHVADGESLQEFPCLYTFKIFGRQTGTFADRVRDIVAGQLGKVPLDCTNVRESRGGRYLSLTIEVHVHTREQLERVYEDLHAEEEVLFCI